MGDCAACSAFAVDYGGAAHASPVSSPDGAVGGLSDAVHPFAEGDGFDAEQFGVRFLEVVVVSVPQSVVDDGRHVGAVGHLDDELHVVKDMLAVGDVTCDVAAAGESGGEGEE